MTNEQERPSFSRKQVVEMTGKSLTTIRRMQEAGAFPDAWRTLDGEWRIPLPNLLVAGLPVNRNADHQHGHPETRTNAASIVEAERQIAAQKEAALAAELAETRHQLELERAKREGLESTLAESKARNNDLSMALRMLEPPKEKPAQKAPGFRYVDTSAGPLDASKLFVTNSPEPPSQEGYITGATPPAPAGDPLEQVKGELKRRRWWQW